MMHTTAVYQVSFMAQQPKTRHDWNWILKVANLMMDDSDEDSADDALPENVIPFFREE